MFAHFSAQELVAAVVTFLDIVFIVILLARITKKYDSEDLFFQQASLSNHSTGFFLYRLYYTLVSS